MLLKSGFKGYCLCKWHRRKERWADNKSAQCRLTSISFWQANFVPEQNVLNYTGSSVLMGEKTLLPSPWLSTEIVHSHHLSQTWATVRGKKNVSWAQDTAPLGAGSGSKSNQGGKDLEAKSGIIRTQVMWACLSPALCKSLTPSLPLASQRSPSNI